MASIGEWQLLFASTEDAAYLPIHMKCQYIDSRSNSDQILYQLHKSWDFELCPKPKKKKGSTAILVLRPNRSSHTQSISGK